MRKGLMRMILCEGMRKGEGRLGVGRMPGVVITFINSD